MFSCDCFYWNRLTEFDYNSPEPEPFSLPNPLPKWPQGLHMHPSMSVEILVYYFPFWKNNFFIFIFCYILNYDICLKITRMVIGLW